MADTRYEIKVSLSKETQRLLNDVICRFDAILSRIPEYGVDAQAIRAELAEIVEYLKDNIDLLMKTGKTCN